MDKNEALENLKKEMEADKSLPLYGTANLVFGEGSPDAEVMFIGEGPGFHEDRLVRPFVGQAGKLLDKLLASIGWPREAVYPHTKNFGVGVYITNILKRRPPENRDPLPKEIEAYKPYLTKQIEIINPKMIVALGRFAMAYFLPEAKISRDHGKVQKIDGRIIVSLYHPAAALRSTQVLKDLEADFKKLPELLKNDEGVKIEEKREATKQTSLF
ncbi:MAG: uracil-DNA glycosylase [Candidatus Giovannonibacteria bacterium]|nr:MAG: uracil-DNA glycosylase [Candidatus Giovannonibacteria bacterium]